MNDNKLFTINSELQKFYTKTREERIEQISQQVALDQNEKNLLFNTGPLASTTAEKMAENVIGTFPLPMSIATNFKINGKDYLIPMVTEEASVVAGASYAAKLARTTGGFISKVFGTSQQMIGQVQIVACSDWALAEKKIISNKQKLIEEGNKYILNLVKRGGGIIDIETRFIDTKRGKMMIVHIFIDVKDAMGANIINSVAEKLAPSLEELSGGIARMKILSNLSVGRIFTAEAIWTKEVLEESAKKCGMTGEEIVDACLDAWAFADADPFRACTNNKGIMNGIDAVVLATGNDTRAIESGAHAYASYKNQNGQYTSLTYYEMTTEGHLKGHIEIPLALGIIGGVTAIHPMAKIAIKTLAVQSSEELSCVIAAVGLAQNFAAIRALVTEGIHRGHMKLHIKNIILQCGAALETVDKIAQMMVAENNFTSQRAKELIEHLKVCNLQ